jgi:hypothetical protein
MAQVRPGANSLLETAGQVRIAGKIRMKCRIIRTFGVHRVSPLSSAAADRSPSSGVAFIPTPPPANLLARVGNLSSDRYYL